MSDHLQIMAKNYCYSKEEIEQISAFWTKTVRVFLACFLLNQCWRQRIMDKNTFLFSLISLHYRNSTTLYVCMIFQCMFYDIRLFY